LTIDLYLEGCYLCSGIHPIRKSVHNLPLTLAEVIDDTTLVLEGIHVRPSTMDRVIRD
jgi:hypothetical protein